MKDHCNSSKYGLGKEQKSSIKNLIVSLTFASLQESTFGEVSSSDNIKKTSCIHRPYRHPLHIKPTEQFGGEKKAPSSNTLQMPPTDEELHITYPGTAAHKQHQLPTSFPFSGSSVISDKSSIDKLALANLIIYLR